MAIRVNPQGALTEETRAKVAENVKRMTMAERFKAKPLLKTPVERLNVTGDRPYLTAVDDYKVNKFTPSANTNPYASTIVTRSRRERLDKEREDEINANRFEEDLLAQKQLDREEALSEREPRIRAIWNQGIQQDEVGKRLTTAEADQLRLSTGVSESVVGIGDDATGHMIKRANRFVNLAHNADLRFTADDYARNIRADQSTISDETWARQSAAARKAGQIDFTKDPTGRLSEAQIQNIAKFAAGPNPGIDPKKKDTRPRIGGMWIQRQTTPKGRETVDLSKLYTDLETKRAIQQGRTASVDLEGKALPEGEGSLPLVSDPRNEGQYREATFIDQYNQEIIARTGSTAKTIDPLSIKGIMFNPDGFDAGVFDREGNMVVDPTALTTMALATEIFLNKAQYQKDTTPIEGDAVIEQESIKDKVLREGQDTTFSPEGGIGRVEGNAELGREIFKSWKREQNLMNNRPSDQYNIDALSNDEFVALGTLAKEMYHMANPHLLTRISNDGGFDSDAVGNHINSSVEFRLTDLGKKVFLETQKSSPDAFRNYEIKPRHSKKSRALQDTRTEKDVYLKSATTVIKPEVHEVIEEARFNMGNVGHVIDPLRRKIVLQLAITALAEMKKPGAIPKVGDFFDVGQVKLDAFNAELNNKRRDPNYKEGEYRPEYELEKQLTKLIEMLNTVGVNSNKVNYLDFVLQSLTHRMHAGQTRFNPQLIPLLRYITGGAVPTAVNTTSTSDANLMFKELMAIHFLKEDADGKKSKFDLPETRVKNFDAEWAKPNHGRLGPYISAGNAIRQSLLNNEQDAKYTEALSNIRLEEIQSDPLGQEQSLSDLAIQGGFEPVPQGTSPLSKKAQGIFIPPELLDVPGLNMGDGLFNEASKEGIEGLHLVEAAHELAMWAEARKSNDPAKQTFNSNIGVEFDGLTHGPASWVATLGSITAGYRTGMFRKPGATQKLDEFNRQNMLDVWLEHQPDEYVEADPSPDQVAGDFRDAMGVWMISEGEKYANRVNPRFTAELTEILGEAIKDKEYFLKKPPMTLSYGQMIENLTDSIGQAVMGSRRIREIMNNKDFRESVISRQLAMWGKDPSEIQKLSPEKRKEMVGNTVIDFLHNILVDAIDSQIHPGITEVGQLIRANAMVSIMSDELMTIESALGLPNYIGAKESLQQTYQAPLTGTVPGNKSIGDIYLFKTQPAGSAIRTIQTASGPKYIVGGYTSGRSIPAIIQAIDGAWMNRMFTDSFKGPNGLQDAYMIPIFDAVKTDLASARRVREHANHNWWNVIKEYNYFDSLMQDWQPEASERFRKHLTDIGDTPISSTNGYGLTDIAAFNSQKPTRKILQAGNRYKAFHDFFTATRGDSKFSIENSLQDGDLSLENLISAFKTSGLYPARKKGQTVKDYKKQITSAATKQVQNLFPDIAIFHIEQRQILNNVSEGNITGFQGKTWEEYYAFLNEHSTNELGNKLRELRRIYQMDPTGNELNLIYQKIIGKDGLNLKERNDSVTKQYRKAHENMYKFAKKLANDIRLLQIDMG